MFPSRDRNENKLQSLKQNLMGLHMPLVVWNVSYMGVCNLWNQMNCAILIVCKLYMNTFNVEMNETTAIK